MENDRIKWNQRFAGEESYLGKSPSPFLMTEIERIKTAVPGRRALDIASGEGRNSIFLASHGFAVTGLDISDVGIAKAGRLAYEAGVTVDFRRVDLEGYCFAESYDLIINFNFLLRDLLARAYEALSPGGIFIVDTIMASPEVVASHTPDFLLANGELAQIFEAFPGKILFSEESWLGEMPTARVLFSKAV